MGWKVVTFNFTLLWKSEAWWLPIQTGPMKAPSKCYFIGLVEIYLDFIYGSELFGLFLQTKSLVPNGYK